MVEPRLERELAILEEGVDAFAGAMKRRLREQASEAEGRSGLIYVSQEDLHDEIRRHAFRRHKAPSGESIGLGWKDLVDIGVFSAVYWWSMANDEMRMAGR